MMNDVNDFDLKNISPQDFLKFGMKDIAYIKPIRVDEKTTYGVYAADGTPLSIMDNFNTAMALVRHNDLFPVTIN